jgi:Exocyst complex subunit Sec15-like
VDGVVQHHRLTDEILGRVSIGEIDILFSVNSSNQGLDLVLINNVCKPCGDRISKLSALSQIAQFVVNLECFQSAIPEMEAGLSSLRSVRYAFLVISSSTKSHLL